MLMIIVNKVKQQLSVNKYTIDIKGIKIFHAGGGAFANGNIR